MNFYSLSFDGSCGPKNPGGTAAYGYILSKNGVQIESGHGIIGSGPNMSNNLAEHYAVCEGMEAFVGNYQKEPNTILSIRGDSRLVINQLNKKWKIKSGLYYEQACRAIKILSQIRKMGINVHIQWVPREQNEECDILSKKDVDKSSGVCYTPYK